MLKILHSANQCQVPISTNGEVAPPLFVKGAAVVIKAETSSTDDVDLTADCTAGVPSVAGVQKHYPPILAEALKSHHTFTASQCLQYFQARLGGHKLKAGGENLVHCPFLMHGKGYGDKHPSLSVNTTTGKWFCHAGCGGGGLTGFEMKFSDCNKNEALKRIQQVLENQYTQPQGGSVPAAPPTSEPEAIYSYTNEIGQLLFQVLRYPGKTFAQRRPDGKGGWIPKTSDIKKVLYRLSDVISATHVAILEGEKDVDTLRAALGEDNKHTAVTTSPGGAKNWRHDFAPFFIGKQVVIFPDNDEAGREYANVVAWSVFEYAHSVKIVELPGLPDNGDVSDFLKTHTAAEMFAIADGTLPWTPAPLKQVLKGHGAAHPMITTLSDITACAVDWLWEPYLAMGALSMVSGDPGGGKTFVAEAIAADLTLGRTPVKHTPRQPARVLYLSVENSPEHVLRPRFDLLGGDPSRFHLIDGPVQLSDISFLSHALHQTQAELMVVDPIQSFLGAEVDAHRANETRPVMDNLARLARAHKCCIMLLRHLSKEPKGRAIHRGLGSIDFTGAVRTELLVGSSADDPAQHALVHIKTNLGQIGPMLGYTIDAKGKFSWTGESQLTAKDLLLPEASPEKGEAMAEAKDFLLNILAKGPRIGSDLIAEADQAGISKATLKRAKKALEIHSDKDGQTGPWMWSLPEGDHTPETQKA